MFIVYMYAVFKASLNHLETIVAAFNFDEVSRIHVQCEFITILVMQSWINTFNGHYLYWMVQN